MKGNHIGASGGDDLTGQVALVAEVMRDLRPAYPGGVADLLDAGVGHAVLEHQPGCCAHDACASREPLAGELRCAVVIHDVATGSCAARGYAAAGEGRASRG